MFPTMQQQEELVRQKLATRKVSPCGRLVLYKYHRNVMYKSLWSKFPDTMECRGHVYEIATGKLIQAAPTKSFNYLQENTWKDTLDDTLVVAHRKINGFLLCSTLYESKPLVTTTGSFDSDYTHMGVEQLDKYVPHWKDILAPGVTDLYEIVHPNDPHIVYEIPGAYHLNVRFAGTTEVYLRGHLDVITFAQAKELAKKVKHEGFMVYKCIDTPDGLLLDTSNVCKLKSDYYVHKKLLMRANASKVEAMYSDWSKFAEDFPPDWLYVTKIIVQDFTKREWLIYTDQERREFIEIILGEK